MAFIDRSQLEDFGRNAQRIDEARRRLVKVAREAEASVFLSHSHKDRDLALAAINFLANQGVIVYVDWLDAGMPDTTSPETAARVRQAISLNRKFVLLLTARSMASRWVPWELGIADGLKGQPHMATLPVREPGASLEGNEYIGLYSTIHSLEGGGWGIVPPGTNQGTPLRDWFRK
jgi:TIR domain-containing protein